MKQPLPVIILAGLPLLSGAANADTPWWQFWRSAGETAVQQAAPQRGFTPEQQQLLRSFLAGEQKKEKRKLKKLPPGLQKKMARGGELPPGWQKKLARGEVVDAQVWAQSKHLPPDVLRRLGPMPPGTEIRYLDDRVFRVVSDTLEIIDILGL
jgi:hypothetical protein